MPIQKAFAWLLCAIMMLSVCGCANGRIDASLTLWYEASTIKIKQNDNGEAVKNASKKGTTLKVSMGRGESEGVQLMMYAKKTVQKYDITVSDLICGDYVLPSNWVDVYVVKYQEATGNSKPGNEKFSTGYLPDPLLPVATAVKYGETSIKKGDNQSIYLDVRTESATAAGIYKGTVTVTADEKTYTAALEVTVYDIDLTEYEPLMTAFSWHGRDHFASAELNSTDEIMTNYYETFLKFKLGGPLPSEGNEGIDGYVALVRKYFDKTSAYRLYYGTNASSYNGVAAKLDLPLLKEYVRAIAKASVEDKKDYLSKAYSYFYTVVDEPDVPEEFLSAKETLDLYETMLADCDAELRAAYAGSENYTYYDQTVSESLLSIPDVIPGSYDINDVKKYGLDYLTVCPEISHLDSGYDRINYTSGRDQVDLWTYTCVGPVYPYPSGHTDDYSLGFRLTSWMCDAYGIKAFLMWANTNYLYREYGEVIDDPWTNMDTGQGRPGDGRLFFPGKKYGLDTCCPSLRIMAYRDGVEDYQLLQAVRAVYEQNGMDAANALNELYDRLFTGTIPITDTYVFEDVRNGLFELLEDLNSGVGMLYRTIEVGFDTAKVEVKCVDDSATLSLNGKQRTPDQDGVYSFTVDLHEQTKLNFIVQNGKESCEYERVLINGKISLIEDFEAVDTADEYVVGSAKSLAAEVNQDKAFAQSGNISLKLVMNEKAEDILPYFAITKDSELFGGDLNDLKSFKLYLYNAGSEDEQMNVSYYASQDVNLNSYILPAKSWTLVEVDMPVNVSALNTIEEFDFNFQKGNAVTVYLDSFAAIREATGNE